MRHYSIFGVLCQYNIHNRRTEVFCPKIAKNSMKSGKTSNNTVAIRHKKCYNNDSGEDIRIRL